MTMTMTMTMKDPRIMEGIPISLSCDLLLSFYLFSLKPGWGNWCICVRVRGKRGFGDYEGVKSGAFEHFYVA